MSIHHHESCHLKSTSSKPLKIVLAIVLVIMVAEVIGGILSGSLALLGDAGHMLVDALALGLSLFAITIARKPASPTRTYGYHRVEIIAALANGTILMLISIYIFYEAYQRFSNLPDIQTPLMLIIAAVGLLANIAGIFLLKQASHANLNIKAAFWHIIGDTISSVGVIIAGLIIHFTGWSIVDPIIAVFIGAIILWGAVRIVKESVDVLLESVPGHVEVDEIIDMMTGISGVEEVHDIHVWTITSGIHALSAHLLIEDQMVRKSADILEMVNQKLAQQFNITHTTLQLECEKCESCPDGMICSINRPEDLV